MLYFKMLGIIKRNNMNLGVGSRSYSVVVIILGVSFLKGFFRNGFGLVRMSFFKWGKSSNDFS